MKNTKRIALAGILSALSVVIMYIAAATEMLSLCGMIAAVFAVTFIYIEYGTKTALSVYGVVSVLTVLILPDKFTAVFFAVYAGYYPILKAKFEGMKSRLREWIFKIGSFNFVLILLFVLSKYVLVMETDTPVIELTVFALANLTFVLADTLATRLITLYLRKYRPQIKKRGLL